MEFSRFLENLDGGYEVRGETFSGDTYTGEASHLVFSGVVFDRCRFPDAILSGCSFTDCTFRSCDLSGARMDDCFFSHVLLSSVKGLGTNFTRAVIRDTAVENCTLRYASFDGAKWDHVRVVNTSFAEASLSGMGLREVTVTECDFSRSVLFRTSMAGMDLRSCRLEGIVIGEDLRELRGATVEEFQAAALLRALGIRVL